MNKKVIIYISIGLVLLLTIVGAIIYKTLPSANKEANNSEQREEGILLEGDNLNAIEAKEEIIIVDGDPEQEIEYAGEDPEKAEERTKYYDENGNEVNPHYFDSSKIVKQDNSFDNYKANGEVVQVDEEVKIITKNQDDCVYNYDQLYTDGIELTSLPTIKDDNYCGDLASGYGDNTGVSGDMKMLYIFGTSKLKKIDFSGIDLSSYSLIQLFNCNNLEYIDMGNYKNTVVEEHGWEMPVSLFTGITVENLKEIHVSNIDLAKWVKKETPKNCRIFADGKEVKLDYIISK